MRSTSCSVIIRFGTALLSDIVNKIKPLSYTFTARQGYYTLILMTQSLYHNNFRHTY